MTATPPQEPPGTGPRSARRPARAGAPRLQDLLQIGVVCGVMIGLGVFLGYLLDQAAGTSPLLTFVGLAFGIVGAATGSYYVIRPYLAKASSEASTTKE